MKNLKLPGGTVTTLTVPGRSYIRVIPEGEVTVKDGTPSCNGADLMHEGHLYHSVLQFLHMEIIVKEVNLEVEPQPSGSVWVREDGTRIPCRLEQRQCMLEEGTIVWSLPPTTCPYALVRSVHAHMTEGAVRGVGKENLWLELVQEVDISNLPCPHARIWKTNVPLLFVTTPSTEQGGEYPALMED